MPRAAAPTLDDAIDGLAKKLKDPDEGVRQQAVEDLATSRKPEAWPLITEALADTSARVADEAEEQLGGGTSEERVKALVGKTGLGAKDALVRRRAAEALGRTQCVVDCAPLGKLLTDQDADVRRAAAHAIELLAKAERLDPKTRPAVLKQFDQLFRGDKDSNVRAAAIPARYAVAEFKADLMDGMISSKDTDVVLASVTRTLADIDPERVVDGYQESIEHRGFTSLRALLDDLVERPSKSSAVSLVNLAKRCYSRRLAWLAIDQLRDWSGQKAGIDEKFWLEWCATLPGDWKPGESAQKPLPKSYDAEANLLGLPVLSRALVVLVDVTGWLSEKRADGTPEKAQFLDQLGAMLDDLPEYSTFEIIPYAASAVPCDSRPVEVKPVTISHAINALRGSNLSGADDFLLAAQTALALPGMDTILVITDSAPVGAHHVRSDLVLEELTQRNRFHRFVIDAILVHPDALVEARWKELCAPSGGRVTKAKL